MHSNLAFSTFAFTKDLTKLSSLNDNLPSQCKIRKNSAQSFLALPKRLTLNVYIVQFSRYGIFEQVLLFLI